MVRSKDTKAKYVEAEKVIEGEAVLVKKTADCSTCALLKTKELCRVSIPNGRAYAKPEPEGCERHTKKGGA